GPAPTTPTGVPLDGGASLLLAGGVGYAIRRLRQRRQSDR
ncbi:PID-CTERM protein-sorting domain-containing protein, partial [Hymenobacter agri]